MTVSIRGSDVAAVARRIYPKVRQRVLAALREPVFDDTRLAALVDELEADCREAVRAEAGRFGSGRLQ